MALKKYALIDGEGNPQGYIEITQHDAEIEGTQDALGYTYREVDFDKDVSTVDSLWYYDSSRSSWASRQPPPSKFHMWQAKLWVFQEEEFWLSVRADRNRLLSASDWTQLPDAPLTQTQKDAWGVYREDLRDIPSTNTNVELAEDIIWPTPPSS